MITIGCIPRIRANDKSFVPIVKVTSCKPFLAGNNLKHGGTISDGREEIKVIIATQLNHLVQEGQIATGTILRLLEFTMTNDIVVLLSVDILTAPIANEELYDSPPVDTMPHGVVGMGQYTTDQYQANTGYSNVNSHVEPMISSPSPYGNRPNYSNMETPVVHAPPQYPSSNTYRPAYGGVGSGMPTASSGGYNPSTNNRPVVRDGGIPGNIMPIANLNPYGNKWMIKARVTRKGDLRTYSNAKGTGCLFDCDLLDSSGEIKATFFGQATCDKFFSTIVEHQMYYFTNGIVKIANKQFNKLKHDYEINLNERSEITSAPEDSTIASVSYTIVKISQLPDIPVQSVVDVLGVVKSATDVSTILSKKQGKELFKRELVLMDDSGADVRVTLWGDKAQATQPWNSNPVVLLKSMQVGDYGGRSLSCLGSSAIHINPHIPEAASLYDLYQSGQLSESQSISSATMGGGGVNSLDQMSSRITIADIRDRDLGRGEKGDFINLKCCVSYIKHNDSDPWYAACTKEGCNKKVVEGMSHTYTCEKCNIQMDEPNLRYILSMTVSDHTGQNWVTLFHDQAVALLKKTPRELIEIRQNEGQEAFDAVFNDAYWKTLLVKARVKYEKVQDQDRLKITALNTAPINYAAESLQLLDAIAKYNVQ